MATDPTINVPKPVWDKMVSLLKRDLEEFKNFPHSLGYTFTHTDDLEATIAVCEGLDAVARRTAEKCDTQA